MFGRRAFLDGLDALDLRVNQGDPGDHASPESYRAIFISDLHLGTAGCQAEALREFMQTHPSRYLYLVQDVVDGWQQWASACRGGLLIVVTRLTQK